MKQYMANPVMTDAAAQCPVGALPAMEHSAPAGPVQVTGQKQLHGEGE